MSSLFTTQDQTTLKPPRRKALIFVPLLLIAATTALFFFTGWSKLANSQEVEVIRARMSNSSNLVKEGKTLFQAAGWVHADPYHTDATALISGVITKIHAFDGQEVKKGQLLAELNSEDYNIALLEAQAICKELELNLKQQKTQIFVLEGRIAENLSLKETALAAVRTAEHKAEILKKSGIGITRIDKEQAELEVEEKKIKAKEYDQKIAVLKAEIEQQKSMIEIAKAKVKVQQVKIDKIELDISRCKIYSPIDGVIQKFLAKVGRKQMLGSDNMHSTTVAEIFDPNELLVMVDVPLNDVQTVKINQKTKIKMEAIPEVLEGSVHSIHGEADYQKNTLMVHVKISKSHPTVRPKMLAQVEFLATKAEAQEVTERTGVFVDKRCLVNGNQLFIVSLDNQLRSQSVQLGEEKDGWIEVLSGINAGEQAVINPMASLKEGQPVKVGRLHE